MGVGRGKMRGNGQEERAEGPGRGAGRLEHKQENRLARGRDRGVKRETRANLYCNE